MTWGERFRAVRMDLTPLRSSRDFRLLFYAGTVFYFGAMVSYVAIPFQIYTLTGSNFAVGAVGLVELAPLIVFGLYGGALADHVDRKKLLVSCGLAQAVFTGGLAYNAFRDDPSVWLIFVLSVGAGVDVVDAAAEPRGADAAHGHARAAAAGQRADQPRHADRRAGRPGGRRAACRLRRHRLVLPHRHLRAHGRVPDVLADVELPAPRGDHATRLWPGSARG